jgi:hypothetical protein
VPLRIAATAELVSLVVLLANLFTVHWPNVSALMGPTHGCAYLFVILATVRHPRSSRRMIASAFLPGVGGLLVLRQLARLPLAGENGDRQGI